ncbi:hypothetical protein ACQP0C_18095 [Nocardia sp. CA-129566]
MADGLGQNIDAAERVGLTVPHREASDTAARLCGAPTNERAIP